MFVFWRDNKAKTIKYSLSTKDYLRIKVLPTWQIIREIKNTWCVQWRILEVIQNKARILKAHSHSVSSRFTFLEVRQLTTFLWNVSMGYSSQRYTVFKNVINKISCFILNVLYSHTHTQLSVSDHLEYRAKLENSI